ncbi:hypothetical protein [Legionella longbeachae]|uniref:Uncharacterized protein n=1 Tax=Legionella longbeachae serogroup 1 (strain NSW150) TaxID=661367 RepID=D3HRG2_LEGLN|nr:hypothetical protein [Legionella longbeachae]CBJ11490.1 hypothetical protein LLO_1133 [Legionella longbeachae NSW150]VEE01994.1 Uncharacterised protein [Legionella oakridgensis]
MSYFQKAITYIRETQEMALFATMADARLSAAFRTSPLFYIMLPFIGFLLTLNALANGYQLAKANNKNFDRWLFFITSMTCAALASISLYGAALSEILSFSFAAGPWFFFSSLIVGLASQLVMIGVNLYRASESPKGSIQHAHYIQATLNNAFVLSLLTAVLGAVIFVMLIPTVAPAAGSAFAITALALTALDILWQVMPQNKKQKIKACFYISEPDLEQDARANQKQVEMHANIKNDEKEPQHHRMFTRCDYSAVIRKMEVNEAKNYLSALIQRKLDTFEKNVSIQDEKSKDKVVLLKKLLNIIEYPAIEISKKNIITMHPLAFQSFWAEKGDVEQLFDAVIMLQNKYQHDEIASPVMAS